MFFTADDPALGRELFQIRTPGATVELLGTGGLPDRPTLRATHGAPGLLGSWFAISGDGPPGHTGFLFAWTSRFPNPPLPGLMQGGCDWIGLLTGPVSLITSTSQPTLRTSWHFASNPAWEGYPLTFQMVWWNATATPPLQLSNGLQTVLGPAWPH